MRFECTSGSIFVFGPAGSGKTVLAMRLYNTKRSKGRVCFICCNVKFRDHMRYDSVPCPTAV